MNLEEKKYIQLLKYIVKNGIQKSDRTNIGTYSIFGHFGRTFIPYIHYLMIHIL